MTVVNASPDVPNNALNRTWYGPSGIITPTSKYSFSSDRYNLTITTVDSTDVGMYTFTAANAVGSDTVTISVSFEIKNHLSILQKFSARF